MDRKAQFMEQIETQKAQLQEQVKILKDAQSQSLKTGQFETVNNLSISIRQIL